MSFALFSRAAQSRDPQASVAATAQALERLLVADDPGGDALAAALPSLSTAIGGHRSFVLRLEPGQDAHGRHSTLRCLHEWVSRPAESRCAALAPIPLDTGALSTWMPRLQAGETISIGGASLPSPEQLPLRRADTQALLLAPIQVRQRLWGIVGLDSRVGEALLGADDVSLLHVFARVLGLALERRAWRDDYADLEARAGVPDGDSMEAFCVHDRKGRFRYVSSGFLGLTGFRAEQVLGRDSLRRIDRQDRPALRTALEQLRAEGRASVCIRYRTADDRQVWLQIELQRLVDDPRGAWLSWSRNVSEREQVRLSLSRQQQSAEIILSSIGDGVITADATGSVDYMNRAAEELTGVSREQARGCAIEEVFPALPRPHVEQNLQSRLLRWLRLAKKIWTLTRPDGSSRRVEYTLAPLMDEQHQNVGMVLSFRDVGATEQLVRQLDHLSSHDVLTGLYDRPRFMQNAQRIVARARERGGECFIACVGLDQMKLVNDGHGHAAGDEVLKQAAAALNAHAEAGELVARLGGDEFSWLLSSNTADAAVARVEELLERLRGIELNWSGRVLKVSASAGMATIPRGEESIQQALGAADTALALAKEAGRGKVHLYRAEDRSTLDRHSDFDWALRLQTALETDGFYMQAQPIVPSTWNGGPILRAEVLIALQDARGGLISPGRFLPAAARTGLIGQVDRQVIRRSIETLRERERRGFPRFESLAVNISGASLGEEDFLADVLALLREVDDPGQLTIEITESEAVSNLGRAQHFIDAVRRRGTRFALDDFGSGLSSFAYLKALPVDYLKIDGMFVRDVEHDPVDRAFVEAIQRIARTMGLKTVAEFVENGAIQQTMAMIGVDYCQGFHISRPKPIAQVLLRADA
ncbi:MAG: EAL domain-containing protein [Xanthomonadales bacterium]|jgi:Amt family ammonium transporter|nr:EAL domain-containing protein [Xanthomonadales bacterium]